MPQTHSQTFHPSSLTPVWSDRQPPIFVHGNQAKQYKPIQVRPEIPNIEIEEMQKPNNLTTDIDHVFNHDE